MKQTVTLHIVRFTGAMNSGAIEAWTSDRRQFDGGLDNCIYLGAVETEIEVPEIDETLAQIEQIEKQIQRARETAEMKINYLMERISKLRAITHNPGDAVTDNDDLPF